MLTKSPNLEAHLLLLWFGSYHNYCNVVFPRGPLSAADLRFSILTDFGFIKLDYIIMVDLSSLYVCGKCMGKGFSMFGRGLYVLLLLETDVADV